MLIEIERSSWENHLNILNYYCLGKKARLLIWEKGKKKILARAQPFISIETYFAVPSEPMLAIILGKDTQVKLGYFIKGPQKITMEKETLSSIKQLVIVLKGEKRVVLEFVDTVAKKPISKQVVYHNDLQK